MGLREFLDRWVPALDQTLFHIAGTAITLASLIAAAVIVVVTLLVSRLVRSALSRSAQRRSMLEAGSLAVTSRLIHYTILLIGFSAALHAVGINLTALFAAGAVFAVAIGFAMQNITTNFVSGIILLFERTIKPGDIVDVEGRIVRIRELGIRSTIARGMSEEDLIIPNSALVQATVRNYTLRDSLYRLDSVVGVAYSSDMVLVRSTLEEMAESLPWRARSRPPMVLMQEFGDSSVNWMVSVWIDDPWQLRQLRSELNEAIWRALKKAGVTIAFPQLDVHFDRPVEEALSSAGAR